MSLLRLPRLASSGPVWACVALIITRSPLMPVACSISARAWSVISRVTLMMSSVTRAARSPPDSMTIALLKSGSSTPSAPALMVIAGHRNAQRRGDVRRRHTDAGLGGGGLESNT